MSYNEFTEVLKQQVSDTLGPGFAVTSRNVIKNNSVEYVCLVINKEGSMIAPGIYLNGFYLEHLNGKSMEEIALNIVDIYNQHGDFGKDGLCELIHTENAISRIVVRLVNYEKNIERLNACPHERVQDLAVTYHYLLSNVKDGLASIRIDDENCSFFGVSPEEMKKHALENTEKFFAPDFVRLDDMLSKLSGVPLPPFESTPLYVLSNKDRYYGATSLLYNKILERIQQTLGTGFYILPSSVNEVLILPDGSGMDEEFLSDMVRSVNREQVPDTDVLSDRIYHYPEDSFTLPEQVLPE
ncbi:MAG: DUF5688 family protein [Lachnospiraceae bacterium]|nr:DUF5688 family protein [Lachnospiraceae bacterium]